MQELRLLTKLSFLRLERLEKERLSLVRLEKKKNYMEGPVMASLKGSSTYMYLSNPSYLKSLGEQFSPSRWQKLPGAYRKVALRWST